MGGIVKGIIFLFLYGFNGFTAASENKLNLITFNLQLSRGYIPNVDERRPFIVDFFYAYDADVLCLQEIWTKKILN